VEVIYFTKFVSGLDVERIGETIASVRCQGLDLAGRRGQTINPDNVGEALPGAMAVWADMGLSVPLVTLDTDAVDPDDARTRDVYRACAEQGVRYIKLGYWHWRTPGAYWRQVDEIRAALGRFEALSREHGVGTVVHTHSGECFGLNASALMTLIRGFDPEFVGAYLDPGHLAVCGEPVRMALDICGEYLKVVAAKNPRWLPKDGGGWETDWCLLSQGLVDWPAAIAALRAVGFSGPISVHGEYSASENLDERLEGVRQDVEFLSPLIGIEG